MNFSYVILACIAPVAVLILLMCGAPMANVAAKAHSAAAKPHLADSTPVAEPPAPSTDQYAVPTEGILNRVNHLPAGKPQFRTEVDNTHTPFAKSKYTGYEDARASRWSQIMQQPMRNLNDAQAKFHKWDKGEASNHMGKVEIRRAIPFLPATERGDEDCALRMAGARFQGQEFAESGVGKRDQPRPKTKRCDDRSRTQMTRGASRALAFPQRGRDTLRPTQRSRRKGWEMRA